jgi:hypothetical protein
MSHKKITMNVSKEDIRRLTSSSLANILARFEVNYKKAVDAMGAEINAGTQVAATKTVSDMAHMLIATSEEMANLIPLLAEIEDLPEE